MRRATSPRPSSCSTARRTSPPWNGCATTSTGAWRLIPDSSLPQTPDHRFDGPSLRKDGPSLREYGFHTELTGEEDEAGPRVRTAARLAPPTEIVDTCPRREVCERCLRAAGFGELTWVPLEVSDAGVRTFGADFWADFLANPPLEKLRCRRRTSDRRDTAVVRTRKCPEVPWSALALMPSC
ncbi:hypothetical protein [Streptomyces sp. CT34]|uniref:hypothetical protein n=1 Tax=Streptomyces sp. CT34 TaxID=1553907 RepID=UPI000691188E|nr:hypothetical protein [Streptomyces sp. CT34]